MSVSEGRSSHRSTTDGEQQTDPLPGLKASRPIDRGRLQFYARRSGPAAEAAKRKLRDHDQTPAVAAYDDTPESA